MKVAKEDLKSMRERLEPMDTLTMREDIKVWINRLALKQKGPKDPNMAYRWELLHRSGFNLMNLYAKGYTDNHIDTALKAIVEDLI
jgi:hypothetical protein